MNFLVLKCQKKKLHLEKSLKKPDEKKKELTQNEIIELYKTTLLNNIQLNK